MNWVDVCVALCMIQILGTVVRYRASIRELRQKNLDEKLCSERLFRSVFWFPETIKAIVK